VAHSTVDVVIAGAGLAGASAALWLSETLQVTLVTGTNPATSSIAAGLVNPFAGLRMGGRLNSETVCDDLIETLKRANALSTYNPSGILRPAYDQRQTLQFKSQSKINPQHIKWLSPDQIKRDHSYISAPHGAAITTGGILATPDMLNCILTTIRKSHRVIHANVVAWKDRNSYVSVALDSGEVLNTKRLILALGAGYTSFSELLRLNLHKIKGQLVYVPVPEHVIVSLPISGYGYIVPEHERLILGTSYDHSPDNDHPTPEATNQILTLTKKMIPWLNSSTILGVSAGIRVGVPGTRSPMVGPLTSNIWIITGLGSKGILLASYIARNLHSWMYDNAEVPHNFRVRNN